MCKICIECELEKEIDEFHRLKNSKDGYRSICKLCRKEQTKNYREKNRDLLRQKQRTYAKLNYEKEKKRSDEWISNNKMRLKERIKKWKEKNKDKVKESIIKSNNSFQHKCRMFLHKTLKRLGRKKEHDTITYLGYSSVDFKNRIEETFLEGMCWENYGEWHIDHIRPISSFDEDTPISEINSLENLRALWAIDNLRKGKSW